MQLRAGTAWPAIAAAALVASGCGVMKAEDVAAGGTRSCIRTTADTVKCWGGRSVSGVLGGPGHVSDPSPRTVPNTSGATEVCGGDYHACARVQGGKVKCWGVGPDLSAKEVSGLSDVASLSCGDGGGCARSSTGEVRCWAWTEEGPGAIEAVPNLLATHVAVGTKHSCAAKEDGTVWCWGDNADGQLGVAPTAVRSTAEPIQVQSVATVSAVAAGEQHSCALGQDGKVRCWGSNEAGQLGAAGGSSLSAVEVEGVTDAVQLSAGENHTCALLSGGTVRCWGRNLYGQLGDGSDLDRNSSVEVKGLADVKRIALGRHHGCALHSDGLISCWGRNSVGQLGDGTYEDRREPVAVDTTNG